MDRDYGGDAGRLDEVPCAGYAVCWRHHEIGEGEGDDDGDEVGGVTLPFLATNASTATPPCHDGEVLVLLRQQIQLWRAEKRGWAWIKKQPVGKAYYDVLGGK